MGAEVEGHTDNVVITGAVGVTVGAEKELTLTDNVKLTITVTTAAN